jgi:hypothetical protein
VHHLLAGELREMKIEVSSNIGELMSDAFMARRTKFPTIQAFLLKSP